MVNGSLEDWLHPVTGLDLLHNEPKKLGLHQRLNISIEVACALDYLHHDCQTPIIHCDLKPSNILLNEDMIGHVGDFGLARFLQEANHNFSAKQGSSTGVRGTIGYTAPEYGMGNEVTTKGDVYSYGILLLEMFTGKRPTDDMFKDSLNLHNFVKMGLPYPVVEVADPMLLWEVEEKTLDIRVKTQEFLISILQIGVTCFAELLKERMNISDVVAGLHSIRSIFLATVHSEQII
ncbi:probable LRR receptor-like serine/threonine-protein kinase At3g47570 [Camellia sinensis]|uniref:probable LRR receptor-like serine/threonine-protein kinase At3g47570 n=1 Tax=Camellia sinensis TaxID=4442 RepID=UPI001036C70E|nr:probable LRR receptor-like serine/threonine-protein kinase At3g47570 [Camellia sinensis]